MTPRPNAITRKVTPVAAGFLTVNAYEIEVDRHDGGTMIITREVMERGHAVGVLAYDPIRDEVVLGNELRPGILAAGEYPFGDALTNPDASIFFGRDDGLKLKKAFRCG